MAKTQTVTEVATLETNATTAVAVKKTGTATEAIAALGHTIENGKSLVDWKMETSNVLQMESGKIYLLYVTGIGEATNADGEVYDVVDCYDMNGTPFQLSDVMAVGTIERRIANELPLPWNFAFCWDGTMKKVKTGKGEYKNVQVRIDPDAPVSNPAA